MTVCASVSAFAQTEKKVAYGILIDNTGSLRHQFDEVIMLGRGIVERTHQQGAVSLFSFRLEGPRSRRASISSDLEWSQDKDLVNRSLDNMFVMGGQTTLRDAISFMAQQLNQKVSNEKDVFAGKVIFLVTDGEDRGSRTNQQELIKALKESGIQVLAIGLVNELPSAGGKVTKKEAMSLLDEISRETGGRAVFQESKTADADRLLTELFAK
ncbi:MAG: vWA domain-containing protein [Pyrinomonadaceae bacterium]